MTLFIVGLSFPFGPPNYGWPMITQLPQYAKDSLEAAKRFSECNVVGLTDMPSDGWEDVAPYMALSTRMESEFRSQTASGDEHDNLTCFYRWFAIYEYIIAHDLKPPFVVLDWEVMVFQPLRPHFAAISAFEYSHVHGIDKNVNVGATTNPQLFNLVGPIKVFYEVLKMSMEARTPWFRDLSFADMSWWIHVRNVTGYPAGDMTVEGTTGFFDANITLDLDRYEGDGGRKKVVWIDKKPYFVRRSDGTPIKAVAIHCFGGAKDFTSDYLAKAT